MSGCENLSVEKFHVKESVPDVTLIKLYGICMYFYIKVLKVCLICDVCN